MHRPFSVGKRAFFIEAHTHTRTRSTIRYDTSIIMDFTGKRPFTAFDGIVSEQPVRFSYHIAQTNTRIIREPCLKYVWISRLHRFSIAMDIENMKISATQSHNHLCWISQPLHSLRYYYCYDYYFIYWYFMNFLLNLNNFIFRYFWFYWKRKENRWRKIEQINWKRNKWHLNNNNNNRLNGGGGKICKSSDKTALPSELNAKIHNIQYDWHSDVSIISKKYRIKSLARQSWWHRNIAINHKARQAFHHRKSSNT